MALVQVVLVPVMTRPCTTGIRYEPFCTNCAVMSGRCFWYVLNEPSPVEPPCAVKLPVVVALLSVRVP